MGAVRGKDAQTWITTAAAATVEISTFTTSVESSFDSDILDTTTQGGTAYKSAIRGFLGYTGSISGIYEANSTVSPDKYFVDLITAAATVSSTLTESPSGSSAGNVYERASVFFQNYKKSIPVDGLVTWSVDYQLASGSVTRATF